MDKTTTLLQMAFVLRLECFFMCKLGRLKSPMVRKRGYECSRLKSPMVRKGLKRMDFRLKTEKSHPCCNYHKARDHTQISIQPWKLQERDHLKGMTNLSLDWCWNLVTFLYNSVKHWIT